MDTPKASGWMAHSTTKRRPKRQPARVAPPSAELMRVAALADIHGNLPALEAVLREVEAENPDMIVFCGDVASGPMPSETIEVLRGLRRARFVRGNADRGLVDAFDGRPS